MGGKSAHERRRRPDRLRRWVAARADQQRRRARERQALPAGGDGEHGQHHDRPGRRNRRQNRRRGRADRAPGRRAHPRRGGGRAPRHDQLRGDLRDRPPRALSTRAVTSLDDLLSEPRVAAAREAVAEGWIVGGTVRDAVLRRPLTDLDLAVPRDPGEAAKAVAKRLDATPFRLSEQFGAWRVVTREHDFTCDVTPLQGDTIEADLAKRDFAANAIA